MLFSNLGISAALLQRPALARATCRQPSRLRWRRARWSAPRALQLLTPAIVQHDRVRLAAAYRRGTAVLALLTFPVIATVLMLAPELVLALLGPAWVGVILPLQMLAPGVFFRMVFQVSHSLATATGAAYAIVWRQGA